MKDLIVLVPDKDIKFAIEGIFSRCQSLNIRQISYDIFIHPLHDPGIYHNAANFLRPFSNQYFYALVFIDYKGSGQEDKTPDNIAFEIKTAIENNGWPNKVEIIVFEPELEKWVWIESPHTARALGWQSYSELKNWLIDKELWSENSLKPERPKEAVEAALRKNRISRSSSIYLELDKNVSLEKCQDQSFKNMRNILQKWFPIAG